MNNFIFHKKKTFILSFYLPKFVFFLIGTVLFSCERIRERAIDTKEVAQQVKDRKPKRITEIQLNNWVFAKGNEIARILQKDLSRSLNQALKEQKIESIIEIDKIDQLQSLDTLAVQYQVKIQKISFNNAPTNLYDEEKAFLNSYQNSEIEMTSQIKPLEKGEKVLFITPIILESKPVGMWSLVFTKKDVIRLIDVKQLK